MIVIIIVIDDKELETDVQSVDDPRKEYKRE